MLNAVFEGKILLLAVLASSGSWPALCKAIHPFFFSSLICTRAVSAEKEDKV